MVGLANILEPASETYAGFAWVHLRLNPDYGQNFDLTRAHQSNSLGNGKSNFRFESKADTQAQRWKLECFESPDAVGLDALVFWRQDAFPGALSVHYHDTEPFKHEPGSFKLSNFDCQKQHYVKADGTRISVLKSQNFWLQIAGKPKDVEAEDQTFSVVFHGGKGTRRRIDALRQLTSLSRDGAENFKLLGRQKMFAKLKNGLIAYNIRSKNGSYKDVAIALFGTEKVEKEWIPEGCALKAKAIRVSKFGDRMVAQEYQSLLPKKVI